VSELAAVFEEHRSHLRQVAYRMLGSRAEAEDAVQETWLKLSRAETGDVHDLRGWLTTVIARHSLDMLRSRRAKREDALETAREPSIGSHAEDRELADAVGLALLVVLDKLDPAERIAFVLHDSFAMPFDDIAPIVGRSTAAARQLASRARRRVQDASAPEVDLATQRGLVEAFIAALRAGDIEALVAVLDPQATVRVDSAVTQVSSAREWATGAVAYKGAAQHMRPVLVDGQWALGVVPHGKLARVLLFDFSPSTIKGGEVVSDPDALAELQIEDLA
jgi:RNA polymerase sigma factor (sigma-70 family)